MYKMSWQSENLERRRNPQGVETEDLYKKRAHQEIETEVSKEEENENQIVVGEIGKGEGFNIVGDYRKNLPPIDDVCPICFDRFTIPCRTNCGHWYCASCILEFWAFRSSIRPCKCPLCSCHITNLVPTISRLIGQDEDVIVVVQKVRQYNSLYIGGFCGFFLKIQASPLVIRRIFRIMMEPHHFRFIYYIMRFLGVRSPHNYSTNCKPNFTSFFNL
ncbi:E3 ubiquitin- ligase RNF170-like [Olea europaea subsp. europaea]|uniref:E3 ubiquitin- ligase RNF170-like n=1 Tax=Olea europaea subsp. europaea TaxID=158383 RepID=A0A8S0SC48_OLEEU|nr:E3 ubiquitin- ligase RNF170-like [Olea europaea subsp. europaea]